MREGGQFSPEDKQARIAQVKKELGWMADDAERENLTDTKRKEWDALEEELAELEGRPKPLTGEALANSLDKTIK
jgi:hypothetical protein